MKRAIMFPNVHEYVRRGMDPTIPESTLSIWRDGGAVYSDLALFWEADAKLVLSPRPIDDLFIDYLRDRFGLGDLTVLSPYRLTSDFGRDVLADDLLVGQVVDFARAGDQPILHAWGATDGAYHLLDGLAARGVTLASPDLPDRAAYWTSLYFDSKAGIRHLSAGIDGSRPAAAMAPGFICHSLPEAEEFARGLLARGESCFVKANTGAAGVGVILLDESWATRDPRALSEHLRNQTRNLPYFALGPVIVEQAIRTRPIPIDEATIAGSVFMNAFIAPDGAPSLFGGGVEARDLRNHPHGAHMGKGSAFAPLAATVAPLVLDLGAAMAAWGYRGHYGVDFLIADDGQPLLLEVNARRSAESHIYDIGARLYGPDWQTTHFAVTRLPLPVDFDEEPETAAILDAIDAINHQRQSDGVRIVPTALSWLTLATPGLGYVIFAPDPPAATAAERALITSLASLGLSPRTA